MSLWLPGASYEALSTQGTLKLRPGTDGNELLQECREVGGLAQGLDLHMGGFPKLGVSFWVLIIIRIIVFRGRYWGPPILGNYQITCKRGARDVIWCVSSISCHRHGCLSGH